MIIPDVKLITEAILFASGFTHSTELAKKLVMTFKFAQMQLGFCLHYEFGLRTIKGVLNQATTLKQ
jgi:hypothetical protein